jgi:hypothetical protein
VLTYPVQENELPPAPWPSAEQIPAELAWKRDAIVWLFAAAAAAATVALGGYIWRRRLILPAALTSLVALVGVGVLSTILNVQWRDHVPATPPRLLVLGPLQIALAVVALVVLVRAAGSEPLPHHPEDAADDLAL